MAKNSMSIRLVDHSDEVVGEMLKKAMLGLTSIGEEAEGFAKDECPVDTGNLRSKISNKVVDSEKALYVGTNVEYAPYVEFGENKSHKVGKAHFIRDSIATHGERYKNILEAALKS